MKELVRKLIAEVERPEDTYLAQDAEIIDIFVEEAEEIVVDVKDTFTHWHDNQQDLEPIKTIRRHFHTLKGSGRMIGANQIGEFAWTVEDLLNKVIQGTLPPLSEIRTYCLRCIEFYASDLHPSIQKNIALEADVRPYVAAGRLLKESKAIDDELWAFVSGIEISKTEVASEQAAEDDHATDEVADQNTALEIPSIYLDEVNDHLTIIREYLENKSPSSKQTTYLIRAIHTLKGSSGMMQIQDLVETSAFVEHALNLEMQKMGKLSHSLDLLEQYEVFITKYRRGLEEKNIVFSQQSLEEFKLVCEQYADYVKASDIEQIDINDIIALNIDCLLGVESDFESRVWQDAEPYLTQLIDETLILSDWANTKHLAQLQAYVDELKQAYTHLLGIAFANYDSLKTQSKELQSAHDVLTVYFDFLASGQISRILEQNQDALAETSQQLLQVYKKSDDGQYLVDSGLAEADTEEPSVAEQPEFSIQDVIQKLNQDKSSIHEHQYNVLDDEELIEIFIEEAEDIVSQMDADLATFEQDGQNHTALQNLMRHLHTLKGGANMIQAENFGLVAHHLEFIYELLIQKKQSVDSLFINIMHTVHSQMAERTDLIGKSGIDYSSVHTLDVLKALKSAVDAGQIDKISFATNTIVAEDQVKPDITVETATITESSQPQVEAAETTLSVSETTVNASREQSLVHLHSFARAFEQWIDDRINRGLLLSVQRIAYVILDDAKASQHAELIKVSTLLVRVFERFAVNQIKTDAYDVHIKALIQFAEHIYSDQIVDISEVEENIDALNKVLTQDHNSESADQSVFAELIHGDGTEPPPMMGLWQANQQKVQSAEMIRISSSLTEKVANLTAESAINRSRIEMGINQFNSTLNDMGLTINRLSEQLRRMQGELESQIIAKHGTESQYEDFDPLEMDQYSSLHQLSKSLAESTSDLLDFKVTLAGKVQGSEALLLEQSRIQTEVQENLLKVRQVSFSLIESRLQRLVKQTSITTGRNVELEVINPQLELDRTILDRLIAPLEHMIRNSIDHGIENREERLVKNKPASGKIQIILKRQGTDIILEIKDDGRGIDIARVRRKAESVGMISNQDDISDKDALQYIFQSGFSTAQKLTQLSGRGVGLDVVKNDIRVLGGYITVNAVPDEGTTFTIQIPTIMTVADALMVKVGDQRFAVTLSQIDRIVRVPVGKLKSHFNSQAEMFDIDGEACRLRYVAEFLGDHRSPAFNNDRTLPLLLIRDYDNHLVALLVDQLVGSRIEIIVKPLNSQLKDIDVLSGATILGDGNVCLILDAKNIARTAKATRRNTELTLNQSTSYEPDQVRNLVMIVDDSVTVRKVTSILLERQGFDVVTANDGLDAMKKLESVKPDVMLLDIEMPNMDGFEVASRVRIHDVHATLPIIMITSRTGIKHRERALNLGVNYYMGKPFQEDVLLETIGQALELSRETINE